MLPIIVRMKNFNSSESNLNKKSIRKQRQNIQIARREILAAFETIPTMVTDAGTQTREDWVTRINLKKHQINWLSSSRILEIILVHIELSARMWIRVKIELTSFSKSHRIIIPVPIV